MHIDIMEFKDFLNGKLFQKSKHKCKSKNFSQAYVVDDDHADMFSSLNDQSGKKYRNFLVRVNKKENIVSIVPLGEKKKKKFPFSK